MAYLLDTHAALWAFAPASKRLSQRVRDLIATAPDDVFVSPVSAYEFGVKSAQGKLEPLPATFAALAKRAGFLEMPVTIEQAQLASSMSRDHRDPWDRLLAAQAIETGSVLVTKDERIKMLGVQTIW